MAKKNFPVQEMPSKSTFSSGISTQVDWEPSTNIIECAGSLIIEVELPGVLKKNISVLLQGDRILIIKGFKEKPSIMEPHVTYYMFEREFGHFNKKIVFDLPLDTEKIESHMENGVLTVRIPKRKPQKVTINIK